MSFIYVPPATTGATGSLIFLQTLTANNSATIDLEGIDSTYQNYMVFGSNINCAGQTVTCRFKINGTYQTTNYSWAMQILDDASPTSIYSRSTSVTTTSIYLADALTYGNGGFELLLQNPSNTTYNKTIFYKGGGKSQPTNISSAVGSGTCTTGTQAVTGLRFLPTYAATFTTGTFTLYGVKQS